MFCSQNRNSTTKSEFCVSKHFFNNDMSKNMKWNCENILCFQIKGGGKSVILQKSQIHQEQDFKKSQNGLGIAFEMLQLQVCKIAHYLHTA